MPFDGRVSLVRWALRGSAVAGAGGEALRRAEMREPKYTLKLPIIIGQTPTVLNRESWSTRHRPPIAATEQSASPSLWQKAGDRCFHWANVFNRSFRNDVNARVISPVLNGLFALMLTPCPLWSGAEYFSGNQILPRPTVGGR